ncbi:MAG: hypothetical protein EHM77_06585, partial [Planctomycetaceae bacterium]
MFAPSVPKPMGPPRVEVIRDSGSERGSVGPPPEVETDSDVDSETHRNRRREEARRRREEERRRCDQAFQERLEEKARAKAAERDRDINNLISRAKALTMDVEDFLVAVDGIVVTGESRQKGGELLATASQTMLELHMVQGVNLDPLVSSLRQAKVGLSKHLARSDAAAAAAAPPPPPGNGTQHGRGGSDALESIALAQIKFETGRLKEDTLCSMSAAVPIQADRLRDIAKVTVPDVRKTVDRLREAMKSYAGCRSCDVVVLRAAQEKCEMALQWITQVEKRMQSEQIYLDQKQPARKVDFLVFSPGTAVSIYEFFQKFEAWARGRLSKDTMANMLYTEYLDKSITCRNKELEEIKLSYSAMKALLFRTYGRPDTVAELYLNNIRQVKPPTSKTDVAGECRQAKEVYGHVVTLTTLEESEGVPVTTVMEHIYRNQFIKSLVAVLPKITRSKFMNKLEDEDLHVIAGKPYIKDIIALLRNEYRRLEVETEIDAAERVEKSVKATSAHQISVAAQSSSKSESSEEGPSGMGVHMMNSEVPG